MEEQFSSEDTFYMLILMQSQNSTSGTYREPHCMLKKVDFLQYLSFNISEITDLVHYESQVAQNLPSRNWAKIIVLPVSINGTVSQKLNMASEAGDDIKF